MTEKGFANRSVEAQIVDLVPALTSFARSFQRQQTDVDDLVQETLLKAFSNVGSFVPGTKLKSWLFTIMRNTFCSRFKVAKRELAGLEEPAFHGFFAQPDQEWHLMGLELERACGNVPEPYKSALKFVLVDGRSYEEAALHFHCPAGTIKSRVNRARRHVVRELAVKLQA
ncbi:RNA polymerase subunit sigma [Rhizobium sp. Root708]|uniref:sigma-70 family RNA polymerase sigma factor n=1 Tax=Rhizobium sp. Root708 TaxID=1736592 RepID=UPI0006F33D8C|nr:sigma-70 family RNA polymerase sigma factor [Rhizobium sp. Root708]KRB57081.1 RNA polymerase subunit sigma [Rhizobium sp. Root708]